jgi:TrmH family RNA methyltransferase
MMKLISTADLKRLRSLRTKKGRLEHGSFSVEGEKGVQEALGSNWTVRQLAVLPELHERYARHADVSVATAEQMVKISGVVTPPGVVAEVALPKQPAEFHTDSQPILACCDIADPGNLGTIIRTADWFGIRYIVVSGQSVDPYNEKTVRSSMGSLFHIEIFQVEDLADQLRQLQKTGYAIVAATLDGRETSWPGQPVCLVMGSESHGIPTEIASLADHTVTIPGKGLAESLNVAISCGILLYDLQRTNT